MANPASNSGRERHFELADELRRSGSAEGDMAREMIKLLYDAAKESLVVATGDDILRLQGEARSLKRIYERLTRTPPSVTTPR